jgi:DNA-binding IclR family transcriptional regulator
MPDRETTNGRRLKSVNQAFNIIAYLQEGNSATLSDIADDFEMPMSTAHIYLSTLVETDYIIKEDSEYRCSLQFLRTGGELRDLMSLFQAAKVEVDDLQKRLGEIANVGTVENGYMVQLYKSENPESIDDNSPLGAHLYLHSTATGKAMLSQLSEAELDRIVEQRGLPESTAKTITNRDALENELAETKERGYAINRGEHFAGVCAVAVPILSKESDVLGSISISGPLSRMGTERIEETLAPELFDKKNIIELKIKQH